MKWKLLLILGFVTAGFMSFVVWRMDRTFFGNRMGWIEAQARSQIIAVNKAIESELNGQARLAAATSVDALKADKNIWNSLQPFVAAAQAVVDSQGQLQITNLAVKEKSPAQAWTSDYLVRNLSGLKASRLKPGYIWMKSFSDANKSKFIATVIFDNQQAKVFVTGVEFLTSLLDTNKGNQGQMMIVNEEGLILSHSVAEYIGARASDDPIVQEFQRTAANQGMGQYSGEEGQSFGYFEKVKGSNIYSLISISESEISKGRKRQAAQMILMGAGFLVLLAALILALSSRYESALDELSLQLTEILNGSGKGKVEFIQIVKSLPKEFKPLADLVRTADLKISQLVKEKEAVAGAGSLPEAGQNKIQEEKMLAYRQIAESLGHELKSPIIATLGYSQVLHSMAQENQLEASEVLPLSEKILAEARQARQVMDRLFAFSGSVDSEPQVIKADVPLRNAIAKLDSYLREKGIEIQLNVETQIPQLRFSSESMMKVYEAVLINAVEAMDRMPLKQIRVNAKSLGEDKFDVEIQDSGEGIDSENLAKVFDPFYTTRSYARHIGMGLSMAYGIVKAQGGNIQISSLRGQGTTVRISFDQSSLKAKEQVTPVHVPADVPVASEEVIQKHVEEKQSEAIVQMQQKKDSPLQVDIEAFLELPPAAPIGSAGSSVEPIATKSDDLDKTALIATPSQDLSDATVKLDGLEFLDAPKMFEVQNSGGQRESSYEFEMPKAPENEDAMMASQIILPPKSAIEKKTRAIDSYPVEIRRPGKRL